MSNDRPTVFILDSDEGDRRRFETLFRSAGQVVSCHATVSSFLQRQRPDAPCCLVLEARLPDGTGLEVQRRLQHCSQRMPMVFVSAHPDVPVVVEAIKSGAVDFLLKPYREHELLRSVYEALDRDRDDVLLSEARRRTETRLATLTGREGEVMRFVAAGMSNRSIASHLGIGGWPTDAGAHKL